MADVNVSVLPVPVPVAVIVWVVASGSLLAIMNVVVATGPTTDGVNEKLTVTMSPAGIEHGRVSHGNDIPVNVQSVPVPPTRTLSTTSALSPSFISVSCEGTEMPRGEVSNSVDDMLRLGPVGVSSTPLHSSVIGG